jgi:hypothetical protein
MPLIPFLSLRKKKKKNSSQQIPWGIPHQLNASSYIQLLSQASIPQTETPKSTIVKEKKQPTTQSQSPNQMNENQQTEKEHQPTTTSKVKKRKKKQQQKTPRDIL